MRTVRRIALGWAAAVVCAAAAVPLIHATPAGAQGSSWTMGGHDLNNTRSNPDETILGPSTVNRLAVDWTATTHGDVSATLAVVDGAVYFPDWGGYFWKVDAESGQVIWSHSLSEYSGVGSTYSRTSPVVVGDTVYIGTHTGARLLAIDTATGNLKWSTQVVPHPRAVITGSAVVYNGVVYQECPRTNSSRPPTRRTTAARSAAPWWRSTRPPERCCGAATPCRTRAAAATSTAARRSGGSTPTIDPQTNTAFIGTGQNYSIPQSASTCETNGGTPAQCLASFDAKDGILAIDLATGAIKWSTGPSRFDTWNLACLPGLPPNNCPNPGPDHDTSDGTHLFTIPGPDGQPRRAVGAGQKSGEFWMLDQATGSIIWSASVGPGSTLGGIEWGTANDGQRIFFTETDQDHVAYQLPNGQTINYSSFGALDAATGHILWQVPEPHGGQAIGPATTANGIVYVGALNGYMYALNALTGAVLWQYQGAGSSNAGPAIVDGKLFWGNGYKQVSTASTTFYAFSLPGGGPTSSPPTSPTVGPSVSPSGSPSTSPSTSPSSSPSTSPSTRPTTPPPTACTAAYRLVSQWPGGFQGEVAVRVGTSAINGWTVRWTFANGQTISQLWNGTYTSSGSSITVRNLSYNAALLPANGTTTFGFLGSWNGSNTAPTSLTCTSP
jgi:polyvinyl alcohol dehydrogenase (cytochrome)